MKCVLSQVTSGFTKVTVLWLGDYCFGRLGREAAGGPVVDGGGGEGEDGNHCTVVGGCREAGGTTSRRQSWEGEENGR